MPLSTDQTVGFCANVLEYMRANKAAFKDAGRAVDPMLSDLGTSTAFPSRKENRKEMSVETERAYTGCE
ncbi:MAG: hypothetical protein AABZ39_12230 [Spirochaetota bacterium]